MTETDWVGVAMNIAMALGSIVVAVTGVLAFRTGRNIGRREGASEVIHEAYMTSMGVTPSRRATPKPFPDNRSTRHREVEL